MEVSFITSYLTFYLKGRVKCDNNFVSISCPNTILKLIPLGSLNKTFPVEQVSSVSSDFKVTLGSLLWGVLITLLGLGSLTSSIVLGLILAAVGALMVLSSLQTVVYVTVAGNSYLIPIIFLEKAKAEQICSGIQTMITNRYADTNVRVHTEKSTDRLVDAINNMSHK